MPSPVTPAPGLPGAGPVLWMVMLPAVPMSGGAGRRYQGTLVLVPVNGKDHDAPVPASGLDPESAEWLRVLAGTGPQREAALARLHGMLVRGAHEGLVRVDRLLQTDPRDVGCAQAVQMLHIFGRTDRGSPLSPDVSRAVGVSDLARRSATGLREDGAVSAHRARITRLMRAFRRMAAGLL